MNKECFKLKLLIVLVICCLFIGFELHAETTETTEITKTTTSSKTFVASVYSSENAIGLKDEISVQVTNLEQLQEEAREKNKKIILFIDFLPLNGIYPTFDRENSKLRFFIDHSDNAIEVWNRLTLSRESKETFTRQVSISVGLEDQEPILTNVKSFPLILARKKWFYICVVMLLVLLGSFIYLARETNILRETGPNPKKGKKRYSLALTQMAAWFFVIISSWMLLYAVKHTFSTITESLVILMGISAGTGIGGVAINGNKSKAEVRQSQNFFKDILSDANGISFHRFQIFAWTLVMVAVFIRQVTSYMLMPEFSPALLTLMGISSGTYLSFKVSEKPETADATKVTEIKETSQTAASE